MAKLETHIFFDRTYVLTKQTDIAEFRSNPKDFLKRIGFFHGLDGFNGFIDLAGEELHDVDASFRSFREGQVVILGHLGIPYQDYCKCVCEVR